MGMDLTKYPGVNSFFDFLKGELQQYNRLAGGPIAQYVAVGADGIVTPAPAIFYGAWCTGAGTMAAIYDNASAASGTLLLGSQVGAANTFYGPGGVGVLCENGIFADWTSGTWLVLCVPQV